MKTLATTTLLMALLFSMNGFAGEGHAHKSKKHKHAHSKEHKCDKCKKSEKDCTCDDKHDDHEGEHKDSEEKK